jgi:photosystem II stability/assembly factor-like uncharacterized protein
LGAFVLACLLAPQLSAAAAQQPAPGIQGEWSWRLIGPYRGGRTRAVAGVPGEPNVFYIGAVNGGVWKSDDAGRTWQPVFDDQPTQSIGAIAVAASDPRRVYVGSGEGLLRPDLSVGNGMYRSDNGGRTWAHLGLEGAQQIAEIAVDPHDANRVFAAVLGHPYGPSADRGIYRSTDGGATWQRVLAKDADTGGCAVAIDPKDPQVVYAGLWQARLGPWEDRNEWQGTGGGLYKSTDGGTTWRKLSQGLPATTAQVNIAIAPSRGSRVFVEVGTTEPGDYSSAAGLGLYRSDDSGESFTRITTDPRAALRIGGGDLTVVRVDPTNPDIVYATGLVTVKSTDGGVTWQSLRGAPGGDDYQNLWISPQDGRIIALVSDQGAVITVNGGQTWSSWLNQPTAQLYHVITTPTFPYQVCAAQQESGSLCIASRGNDGSVTGRDWHPVGVIEYGYVAPDPLDPDVIYGAGRTEVSRFHISTGQVQNVTPLALREPGVRADRTEPIAFSPLDPHVLYYGASRLYRTTNGGMSWEAVSPDLSREQPEIPASVGSLHLPGIERQRGVIYSLGLSPRDAGVLWAGTDDGQVWVTRDGGSHWSNVTPRELSAWSKVTQIDASHFEAGTAFICVSRMRVDDLHPYLYRTADFGATWQPISTGLPDSPVNSVREDRQRRGLLFAATETAVWVSSDAGDHWDSLQLNLPHTSMRDLWIHDQDLIVGTHGRSIWILDDISRLRQAPATPPNTPWLVAPAAAWRVQRSTWTDTPLPPDEPLGTNPPAGAVIDYYLPRAARGPLTLEVLDGSGAVVRRYRSDDVLRPTEEEIAHGLIPPYWIAHPRALPVSAGMHRWVWDLRHAPPAVPGRGYPISAVPHATPQLPQGPLALPGEYRVRLSVDGHRLEAPLTLKQDPRVRLPAGALEEQLGLALRLSERLGSVTQALLAARSEEQQLKALKPTGATGEAVHGYLQRLEALLEPPAGEAPPEGTARALLLPQVQERLEALYTEVTRGDAAPTDAQRAASDTTLAASTPVLQAWQRLQADLPALAARLHADKLGVIRPDLPLPRDVNVADEE